MAAELVEQLLRTGSPPQPPSTTLDEDPPTSQCWRTLYPECVKKKRKCSEKDPTRWLQAEGIYGEVFGDKPIEEITTEDIGAVEARLSSHPRPLMVSSPRDSH